MSHFSNQTILITGGAKGIGACIAQTFLNHGARIIFLDVDKKTGEERERIFKKTSGDDRVVFMHTDLSKKEQIEKTAKILLKKFPSIDVLINNAGVFSQKEMTKREVADWEKVLTIDLSSMYFCVRAFHSALVKAKGNVINIASTRALMSEKNTEPYSAAKGGIVALTHAQAISLGEKHIRVNCISPGWIDTAAWQLPPQKSKLRKVDHEQHPVGRVGKPEDIAYAALFLANNESSGFITGQNFIIDGGMTRKMIYAE